MYPYTCSPILIIIVVLLSDADSDSDRETVVKPASGKGDHMVEGTQYSRKVEKGQAKR